MVIGEAPGRFGADQSGLPFHGDKAGHNFEALIGHVGITRDQLFITNAVLCNPKDDHGNNAPPSLAEISSCSGFLRRQIDLVNPMIVVTLGSNALRACSLIESHSLVLSKDVRTSNDWFGRELIPLYHPGQRAMLHRSMANQRSDYQFFAERLRRLGGVRAKQNRATKVDVSILAQRLTEECGDLTYFALHKLAYLVEYEYWKERGSRLTSAYFVRQKDGPYCVDLHHRRLIGIATKSGDKLMVSRASDEDLFSERTIHRLMDGEGALKRVVDKCKHMTDDRLKTLVYLTRPMRRILRRESQGDNLYNAPINFADLSGKP
jgi:uracil-DNA glycosylase family 4